VIFAVTSPSGWLSVGVCIAIEIEFAEIWFRRIEAKAI